MLHFTEDCNTIVVTDEGDPFESLTGDSLIDPEGSVTIIRLGGGSPINTTLNFTAFNDR